MGSPDPFASLRALSQPLPQTGGIGMLPMPSTPSDLSNPTDPFAGLRALHSPAISSSGVEFATPTSATIPGVQRETVRGTIVNGRGETRPVEAEDHDRGILGTIVNELVADVRGTAKIAAATALSPIALLGAEVPITFEDISKRDVQGLGMTAATILSGGLAHAARGTAVGAKAGATMLGRAGMTAGIEATGGLLYGSMRERQPGESRLEAMAEEAAVFAALGGAGSMLFDAGRAVIGGMRAGSADMKARVQLSEAAQKIQSEIALQEHLGVTLLNPETRARAAVRRDSADKVVVTFYEGRRVSEVKEFNARGTTAQVTTPNGTPTLAAARTNPMQEALGSVAARGYLQEVGPFRRQALLGVDFLPEQATGMLGSNREADDVLREIGALRIGEYRAVQEAAQAFVEREGELARLAAEIVVPSGTWGEPKLIESTKRSVAADLGIPVAQVMKMRDSEVIQQLTMKGLVSVDNLEAGLSQREMLRQLFVNEAAPDGVDFVVNRARDAMLTSLRTPFKLAASNPEIEPLVRSADQRMYKLELELRADNERLHVLKTQTNERAQEVGARIIDETAVAPDGTVRTIEEARLAAMQAAALTKDPAVMQFVGEAIPVLQRKLDRLREAGMLPSGGRTGYFPIVNQGEWKLEVTRTRAGKEVVEFQGFVASQEEARKRLADMRALDPTIRGGTISPKNFVIDSDFLVGMSAAQYQTARKALMVAASQTLSFDDAGRILESFAKVDPRKKGAGNLKERVLGLRDFSIPPIRALELYVNQIERAIHFRDFEEEAAQIIAAIPANKPKIRAWAEQYTADILGRPRPYEQAFQSVMNSLSETTGGRLPVPPRALSRYTAALRKWETFSRLGGFWSGIVNTTQIAVNTYPVLGEKWTGKGMEALSGPKKWHEVVKTLDRAGVDLEVFTPFTEAGEMPAYGTIRGAIKEKRHLEAANRIGLFVFNGAEKVNRVVTAWGAFNKGISEGMGKDMAAEYARSVVQRTQFNYRLSNVPELMRGPIGQTLLQFKSFVINEIEFIASLRGAELARFGLALQATGGLAVMMNMPGTDVVDAASAAYFDRSLSEALKLAPESRLGKGIVYGLPGAALDVDLSDYVGVGTLADITRGIFGPGVSDAQTLWNFLRDGSADVGASGRVSQETLNVFAQRGAPSAIRRAMRGYEILETGEIRNPYSNKLLYAPENRLRSAIATGLGAPSIQATQDRVAGQVVERTRTRFIRIRTIYAKEAALALREGRKAESDAILDEARAQGYAIDASTLRYWMRELGKPSEQRRERRTPRALREDMQELFDATGSLDVDGTRGFEMLRWDLAEQAQGAQ